MYKIKSDSKENNSDYNFCDMNCNLYNQVHMQFFTCKIIVSRKKKHYKTTSLVKNL